MEPIDESVLDQVLDNAVVGDVFGLAGRAGFARRGGFDLSLQSFAADKRHALEQFGVAIILENASRHDKTVRANFCVSKREASIVVPIGGACERTRWLRRSRAGFSAVLAHARVNSFWNNCDSSMIDY